MKFQLVLKRILDFIFALLGLILLSPLLIVIRLLVKLDSKGPVFYKGERVGKFGKIFKIYKFRTMVPNAEKIGTIHASRNDPRITKIGKFLRRSKLDELPQLINVLNGEMSFVGPRPQVKYYVDLYTEEEKIILNVSPGMTDYASIYYINQEDFIDEENVDKSYREKIEPQKNKLRVKYAKNNSLFIDAGIFFQTIFTIIKKIILKKK
ncbi:sugar transferase [Patescibacteria group bacterium]|nr:sugar transferase [Patescibacteria group bacterium]